MIVLYEISPLSQSVVDIFFIKKLLCLHTDDERISL